MKRTMMMLSQRTLLLVWQSKTHVLLDVAAENDENPYIKLYRNFKYQHAVILGNCNAYSPVFGAVTTDRRADALEELMDQRQYVVLNSGEGTYIRRTGVLSHLDIAMVSNDLANVCNWAVIEDPLGSDHLAVIIAINQLLNIKALTNSAIKRQIGNNSQTTAANY